VIVPVKTASSKEEYTAYTFRPRIHKQLEKFLKPLPQTKPNIPSINRHCNTQLELDNFEEIFTQFTSDDNVKPAPHLRGGTTIAKSRLQKFLATQLDDYHLHRNDPSRKIQSDMSPYLHFGQISPLFIALQVEATESPGKVAYLEELIVRRELSINYVYNNSEYETLQGLPHWAQQTLRDHQTDHREYNYSLDALEQAETHDPYWNAAQREMMITGKMHGYMRMYWGKKILEWSKTPKQAFTIALYLNNKYQLDGRDPNSYTGIAWCFGKHDRPWKERAIFGKIRYMNDRGLQRKFKIDEYVHQINLLS
jgi:deoxyribodipyrimidine photo-lyase